MLYIKDYILAVVSQNVYQCSKTCEQPYKTKRALGEHGSPPRPNALPQC